MKNTILIIALSLLVPCACIDDKGNYTYVDAGELAPVAVTGIGSSYTVEMMDTLSLSPVLAEGADEADYDYLWYVYASAKSMDTISREKNLSYIVALAPEYDYYRLVFQITNKKTGVYKFYRTTLNVITALAEGWYITKDIDQVTDIDIVSPDGSIARDVLKSINGEGVPGEGIICADARSISVYMPVGEEGQSELWKNHDCFYIMTRSTVQLYDVETMLLMQKMEGLFMLMPDVIAPQSVSSTSVGKVIVNNGVAYSLYTYVDNVGKWGAAIPDPIDPVNMCRSTLGALLVFDTLTRSLKQLNPRINACLAIQPLVLNPAVPGANNMNYDMVFMQEKLGTMQGGVAIMKELGTGDYYGLTINGLLAGGMWENPVAGATMLFNPIATHVLIPPGRNVLDARFYGTHEDMNVLYFSKGDNEAWYYDLVNTSEAKIASFPAGETVTYVNTLSHNTDYNLCILTEKDGNWNLYIYDFQPSSPLVAETPEVYSGEGIARHVHYRSLSSNTSF